MLQLLTRSRTHRAESTLILRVIFITTWPLDRRVQIKQDTVGLSKVKIQKTWSNQWHVLKSTRVAGISISFFNCFFLETKQVLQKPRLNDKTLLKSMPQRRSCESQMFGRAVCTLMSSVIDFVDRKQFAAASTGQSTPERWGPRLWWRR